MNNPRGQAVKATDMAVVYNSHDTDVWNTWIWRENIYTYVSYIAVIHNGLKVVFHPMLCFLDVIW